MNPFDPLNLPPMIQQAKAMKRDVQLTEDVWRLIRARYGREALLCRELNWCVEQALSSYEPTGVHDAVEAACWVFRILNE